MNVLYYLVSAFTNFALNRRSCKYLTEMCHNRGVHITEIGSS